MDSDKPVNLGSLSLVSSLGLIDGLALNHHGRGPPEGGGGAGSTSPLRPGGGGGIGAPLRVGVGPLLVSLCMHTIFMI